MTPPRLGATRHERVWDPFVRVFHWSLVAAFATAWYGRGEAAIHENAGKVVLALVILRTAWGIIGPGSARFETFVRGPLTTFYYVLSIFRGKPKHYLGHNPAGAAMILLMLAALATTTASGILMTTTALWGNGLVEYIHGTAAYVMLFLIAGHVLGVLVAAFQHRENLPLSMITGTKWIPAFATRHLGKMRLGARRLALAASLVAASAAIWVGSSAALNASIWRLHKTIAGEAKTSGCQVDAIEGPVVSVYPGFHVAYSLSVQGHDAPIAISLDGGKAMQKKPLVDLGDLSDKCRIIAARLERIRTASTSAVEMVVRSQNSPAVSVALSSALAERQALPASTSLAERQARTSLPVLQQQQPAMVSSPARAIAAVPSKSARPVQAVISSNQARKAVSSAQRPAVAVAKPTRKAATKKRVERAKAGNHVKKKQKRKGHRPRYSDSGPEHSGGDDDDGHSGSGGGNSGSGGGNSGDGGDD